MRKILTVLVAAIAMSFTFTCVNWAQGYNTKEQMQQLKLRQKQEWNALKLKEKYMKQSWKNQGVPNSVREQMKHQLQREKRALHEKQKNEAQDLKDQQRVIREHQSYYSQ
jgi:hypothetical protein